MTISIQPSELRTLAVRDAFAAMKKDHPARLRPHLNFGWSNWGFGMEPLAQSVRRLAANGIQYIELHGNLYGPSLGYKTEETKKILSDHGVRCSGICGMFSAESELASNRPSVRQRAIDYIRRNAEFGAGVGATYLLIVPAAVGRPSKLDDSEFERSVETLAIVADVLLEHGLKGIIEPIRSAEVSIVHTFEEALSYIEALNHPAVQHLNGDCYHMQVEEVHIAETLMHAGDRLINLHIADSNRRALGDGSLDLDTMIMALYLINHNQPGRFVTAEPLGPGSDPYPAMYGKPNVTALDSLVQQTARVWRERDEAVRGA